MNRQRGHWKVPCRHSIAAPQRRQISTYGSAAALMRLTLARDGDGYDGRRGAVAERLGRGLQSLVQRFESARRLYWKGLEPGTAHEMINATAFGRSINYLAL